MSAIISDDEEPHSPVTFKTFSSQTSAGSNSGTKVHEEADIVGKSLVGVVDIGSNGIRFSISSVAPHHARTMPCVFKDRLNVSLFEVQYENGNCKVTDKTPIPNEVIYEVCKAMKRFQIICSDFGVDGKSVRVVATEATREARNSEYFRKCIYETTGWTVELLSKEDEGKIGSYGVVSSYHGVSGLFMDLGGGSTQINWIHSDETGAIQFSKKPISLPYGAAALTRRLRTEKERDLFLEIKEAYSKATKDLDIPEFLLEKAESDGGFHLFCSGGGLRGLGNLLLSQNPSYPITTIINGYACSFKEVSSLTNFLFLKNKVPDPDISIFRVSERRKQQLPAIGLLISAAFESLPKIRTVHFSQGGVREGALFEKLPRSIRSQDPLIVATKPYAPFLVDKYLNLLRSSLPKEHVPKDVYERIAPALCNLAFVHCMYPKELQPTAALQVAITGIIAGAHGLSHRARALIGLALCERWGAELPENQAKFRDALINTVLRETFKDSEVGNVVFWTIYIGKIMFFICGIHPGGNINEDDAPFEFRLKTKEIKDTKDDDSNSNNNNNNNNNIDSGTCQQQQQQQNEAQVFSKVNPGICVGKKINQKSLEATEAALGDDVNDLNEADSNLPTTGTNNVNSTVSGAKSANKGSITASAGPGSTKRFKFENVVRIDAENLKIGSGAGNRIKSIQKKMKKLSKAYNIKLKFDIQYVNSHEIGKSENGSSRKSKAKLGDFDNDHELGIARVSNHLETVAVGGDDDDLEVDIEDDNDDDNSVTAALT